MIFQFTCRIPQHTPTLPQDKNVAECQTFEHLVDPTQGCAVKKIKSSGARSINKICYLVQRSHITLSKKLESLHMILLRYQFFVPPTFIRLVVLTFWTWKWEHLLVRESAYTEMHLLCDHNFLVSKSHLSIPWGNRCEGLSATNKECLTLPP